MERRQHAQRAHFKLKHFNLKLVLDALLSWADSISGSVAAKSALGKALHYLREQWPSLIRYLEDGRLELSNNRAERSIKPFVIGRKNFLFANSPPGRPGQRRHLQPHRDGERDRTGPLPVSGVGAGAGPKTGSGERG